MAFPNRFQRPAPPQAPVQQAAPAQAPTAPQRGAAPPWAGRGVATAQQPPQASPPQRFGQRQAAPVGGMQPRGFGQRRGAPTGLAAVREAEVFSKRPYFPLGQHTVVRVDEVKIAPNTRKGSFYIIDCTIIETLVQGLPSGYQCGQAMKYEGQDAYGGKDIKAFVAAVCGVSPNDEAGMLSLDDPNNDGSGEGSVFSEESLLETGGFDAAGNATGDQPLAGKYFAVSVTERTSSKGAQITDFAFEPCDYQG